ncbi:MAG: RluA family pseudouridine synthase [Pseudomonadota bacterium]
MKNRPIPNIPEEKKALIRALILYEDDYLYAFNKPSGLPVQTRGNRGISLDHLLWTFARSNGKRPHLVHRIDAGTSGIVLAAKTKPDMKFLSAQFAERRVEKRYFALVSGTLPDQEIGFCDVPLLKTDRSVRPGQVDQGADLAFTRWRILTRNEAYALVEAHPKTGRMHQIRAHLAYLGCPILGDTLYGAGKESAERLMLHAASLAITVPNKEKLALEAPVPEDFQMKQAELGL